MVTHPMKQGTYQVSSGYGPRWDTFHAGLDFAAPIGTPIYAAADGVVVEGRERYNVSGFGSWIWLDCQDSVGKDFIYGHVKHDGILVKAGDRVRAGQKIGVVGNEGQSTGPHLHFEVWGSPGRLGGSHQDPAPYLANAAQPGNTLARPVGKQGGTIYGIDISEHNDGLSCVRAKQEGIDFAIIRLCDGTYVDPVFHSHLADAEQAGMLISTYWYLRAPSEGTTIAQQVDVIDQQMAGRRDLPVWIDVESIDERFPPGDPRHYLLRGEDVWEAKRELERRGYRVPGVYSGAWYWEHMPGGEPSMQGLGALWCSNYGDNNGAGEPRALYASEGGDRHPGWDYPLGDRKPDLLQFGSRGTVAGRPNVDINAYRGTKAELQALFSGKAAVDEEPTEEEMNKLYRQITAFISGYLGPQIDAIQEIWRQLRGPGGKGWEQLGQNERGQNLTLVDAVAAIRQQLAQIQADVNELKRRKK